MEEMAAAVAVEGSDDGFTTELRGGVREADPVELHADPAKAKAMMDTAHATLGLRNVLTARSSVVGFTPVPS